MENKSGSIIEDHSTLKLIWTNHRSKLLVLLIVEQKLFVERKLEISVSLALMNGFGGILKERKKEI